MTFRRRQRLGWMVLALAVLLGGGWLVRVDFSTKLSIDVLDLIPADEQAPELTLVRSLAGDAEARTVLLVLTAGDGRPVPSAATRLFASALAEDPAFDQALAMDDPAPRDALGSELFARRFPLLFPSWLAEQEKAYAATGGEPARFSSWLAEETVARLQRFLATPEGPVFADIIPADPLLLLPDAATRLQAGLLQVQPQTASEGLVWARLAASPLSEAGQAPAFDAVARALEVGRSEIPGLEVAWTGVNRFAAASRALIEREVKTLNAFSLAAVLLVALTFIRSVHRGLHLVPVVLLSILGAWVGATLVFERLHILVFVVGSLLTGVAIDYGFYLFMQPPARPGEEYPEKVRRLAKPLLASCLTAVAGFALLLFSDLPFIRQLGVYVGTGLVCALAAAVIYFATVRDPYLDTRTFRGGRALPARWRRGLRRMLLVAWLLALPGLFRLTWRDDIRELEIPSPALMSEDARIRGLFGGSGDQTVYLTYGDDLWSARESLDRLEAWLEEARPGGVSPVNLGPVVPSPADWRRAAAFMREEPEFADHLRRALNAGDFDDAEFTPFFVAYESHAAEIDASGPMTAVAALQERMAGPVGLLLHAGQPLSWFVTIAAEAPADSPPPETNTVSSSQLQSLNRIFARYRESAMGLSLIGLGLVGAGVFLTYGMRDGVRIFAIPCGACLGIFGLFGWMGEPLNLFHLLGAFLGVCMTHNYSIFSATSAYRHESPPVSVRMSALTTAASFGVLATSGIPVVSALGTTVALMVLVALLMIELEHLAGLAAPS